MTGASCKQMCSLKSMYPVIIKLWHVTCRPQKEWHTKSLHLTGLGWERGGRRGRWWLRVNQQQCVFAPEGFNTTQKYIIKFNVDNNTLAAPSSMQNEVYRVQLKVEQQQLILMAMQKMWSVLHLSCSILKLITFLKYYRINFVDLISTTKYIFILLIFHSL